MGMRPNTRYEGWQKERRNQRERGRTKRSFREVKVHRKLLRTGGGLWCLRWATGAAGRKW